MFKVSDYDYELPQELVAQYPSEKRDRARLMHLNRQTGAVAHMRFADILNLLRPSDLLMLNNTQVIPARLYGKKESGGKIELLILNYPQLQAEGSGKITCECLIRASRAPGAGTRLFFGNYPAAEVKAFEKGRFTVEFQSQREFEQLIENHGEMPLPPYIRRQETEADRSRYQTVYASRRGAVAAPTAGLHFTEPLLEKIREKGVESAALTLHVSYGTFMPIRVTDIREHRMHEETYEIPGDTAAAVNRAKAEGRRIVAVGTTTVRTLEYAADAEGRIRPHSDSCDLFIYPGYRFRAVDAIITNFHLPRSTLLMLVSAFAGKDNLLAAYRKAIRERYRFYSYGDAMLIEDPR
ncbi:MAG: tRNA preQ1(34) S-adenosylmethionine ribosyltransferase-isomerase QueA [Desulfosalsimonadaceae bacterium]